MKAILFALFVALLMVGCGEPPKPSEVADMNDTAPKKDAIETAIDWSKLQDRDGVMYPPNEETPFTGRAESFHENGQKVGEVNWKDGKQDGLKTFWDEDGQKFWEGNFKDGRRDGLATSFYENGQKSEQENYKDGKQDGLKTNWYENGQKFSEGTYKDGKMDGLSTEWHENGQKSGEGNYKDGKLWTAIAWKPNGEKCPVTNVKDGNGVVVSYNLNGTERYRLTYKDGGFEPLTSPNP